MKKLKALKVKIAAARVTFDTSGGPKNGESDDESTGNHAGDAFGGKRGKKKK